MIWESAHEPGEWELVRENFSGNRTSELDFERPVVQFRWSRGQIMFQAEDTECSRTEA